MKKILMMIMVIISCSMTNAQANVNAIEFATLEYSKGSYDPQGDIVVIRAKGLVCEFCAKALEKVFMRRDEVSGITVDLSTKNIVISVKEGLHFDEEVIRQLVRDAGYNIAELQTIAKGLGNIAQ